MTIKQLVDMLKIYNQDMEINNEQNEPFVHMVSMKNGSTILSTKKPKAICIRTGGYVYPTTTQDYFGYSPELDEDVYEFETEPLN